MSAVAPSLGAMENPWRRLRELAHVTLHIRDLEPGLLGYCDHDAHEIHLTTGMGQRQRRSVLRHELEHYERGLVYAGHEVAEEQAVDQATAHALIELDRLADALAWSRDPHEVAVELSVSLDVLKCRMQHLHPSERAYLKRRLSDPADTVEE